MGFAILAVLVTVGLLTGEPGPWMVLAGFFLILITAAL